MNRRNFLSLTGIVPFLGIKKDTTLYSPIYGFDETLSEMVVGGKALNLKFFNETGEFCIGSIYHPTWPIETVINVEYEKHCETWKCFNMKIDDQKQLTLRSFIEESKLDKGPIYKLAPVLLWKSYKIHLSSVEVK